MQWGATLALSRGHQRDGLALLAHGTRTNGGHRKTKRLIRSRLPCHGEDRDIFERIHAVRLDRIRDQDECRDLVAPLDYQQLLEPEPEAHPDSPSPDDMDDDALLAALGVEADASDITELRHVRSSAEKRAAEEVATRDKCEDFETFRPLFEQVQRELDAGIRATGPLGAKADIEPGRFFIVGGQKAYVAEMGKEFTQEYGDRDARLRVIFDNGTESNMLRRSLQRALHKDEAGRQILDTSPGPLFTDQTADGDEASGTIYVLRSKAQIPFVAEHRNLVHKIGVTNAMGTPQGNIVSPELANVFLHYALDLWFHKKWRPNVPDGEAIIVRYADDVVVGFQHKRDAERYLRDVREGLARFGLSLHPDKTRLVEFGRFASLNRRQRGVGKPETFDFLGFAHYCTTTRRGRFRLGRKPVAKRVNRTLARIDEVLRKRWHHDIWEVGEWLGRVYRGWLNYFAVPGSGRFIRAFRRRLQRLWMRALRRRSQRARFDWKRLERMTELLWPRASIRHPWPDQRFAVNHPR